MDIAALITWVVTALGGFYMLGVWLSHGGARGGSSHLPVPVVFGHFALAAIGLVVWIIHVLTDDEALAWTAFALLLPVALLGFVMLARWISVHPRQRRRTGRCRPECAGRTPLPRRGRRRTRARRRRDPGPGPAHRTRNGQVT